MYDCYIGIKHMVIGVEYFVITNLQILIMFCSKFYCKKICNY